jgi:hypothetical protein
VKSGELAIHRKNTLRFIEDRPTSVVLTPRTKQDTPAGGSKWTDGTPRAAQTFRIIELGMMTTPPVIQLTNGTQRQVEYWLLGAHDAAMATGDYWTDGNLTFEVGEVVRDNGYETRGLVAERGKQG